MFIFCSCTTTLPDKNNSYRDKSFLYLKKNPQYEKINYNPFLVSGKTLYLKKSTELGNYSKKAYQRDSEMIVFVFNISTKYNTTNTLPRDWNNPNLRVRF